MAPGAEVKLIPVFQAGPLGSAWVEPEVGPVAPWQEVAVKVAGTGTYTLTVDNGAGERATARVEVYTEGGPFPD